ncbi:hypothetical protein PR003_g32557 [Phytophthora rubi]|uniref:Pectate lyase n=1 Tax=Phytophthora rubi TaxID=129364 RepID=A0A6A3G792_9STRA|nr:hypothetical protein PR002_g32383 [Phytophthora rubi]KAE9265121.1 hypothetical protein PR003_g32557 [Phytophthora rubi]
MLSCPLIGMAIAASGVAAGDQNRPVGIEPYTIASTWRGGPSYCNDWIKGNGS